MELVSPLSRAGAMGCRGLKKRYEGTGLIKSPKPGQKHQETGIHEGRQNPQRPPGMDDKGKSDFAPSLTARSVVFGGLLHPRPAQQAAGPARDAGDRGETHRKRE